MEKGHLELVLRSHINENTLHSGSILKEETVIIST